MLISNLSGSRVFKRRSEDKSSILRKNNAQSDCIDATTVLVYHISCNKESARGIEACTSFQCQSGAGAHSSKEAVSVELMTRVSIARDETFSWIPSPSSSIPGA